MVALGFIVMDVKAKIFPLNEVLSPIVAELPTCQKILDAKAPPQRITLRPGDVFSVDAICIMNTAPEFPFASKFRSPDEISREEFDL